MGNKSAAKTAFMGLAFALAGFAGAMAEEEARFDRVNVRTWLTQGSPAVFPERTDDRLAVEWLAERPSFAISFSGGGARAATAALGQLRALDRLEWIDKAQYISANSGGTWTSVPYIYLPRRISDRRFLGDYLPPGAINDKALSATGEEHAMARAIHSARVADLKNLDRLKVPADGDEAYANLVGKIFLDPFGLHDRKKFFSFDEKARREILSGNPHLKADDFYVIERQRPFLIMVGTLLGRQTSASPDDRYLFEVTPLYVGTRSQFPRKSRIGRKTLLVGGGYLEPFGYDSYEPEERLKDGRLRVRLKGKKRRGDRPDNLRYRFTLSDAIGMSSAAPLARLTGKGVPNFLFPEFRHWTVDRKTVENDRKLRKSSDEFQHGDGGDIDNLALLPLLARQVENILVFVNTSKIFPTAEDANCKIISEDLLVDDVISLFRPIGKLTHNTVFKDGENELETLCEAFRQRRAAGKSLVHCQRYEVAENGRQAIHPYRPNICWVYLNRVKAWIDLLPGDRAQPLTLELKDGAGEKFSRFPHYRTFGEGASMIDLDPERVHALSNLAAWTVLNSADEIARGLVGASLDVP